MTLRVGSATRIVNGQPGDDLLGQLHRRIAVRTRDDLEANIVYLADDHEQVMIIGLDASGVWEIPWLRETSDKLAAATGVPARHILLCCSHTHTAPNTGQLLHDAPTNTRYLDELREALADGCREAVAHARAARAGWATGHAHVGYNRRLCWADGSHSMYGDSTRPDFTGTEGPDDPRHALLALVDEAGAPIALLHNNCCHMTTVEGADYFSSDFAGEARRLIREGLYLPALPIVYLQGASGDTSPWNLLRPERRPERDVRLHEIGTTLAAETLRLYRDLTFHADVPLRHAFADMPAEVRRLTPEQLARAEAVREQGEEKAGRRDYVLQVPGALRLHEMFHDDPVDHLALHAVRLGDWVMVTNPCELYCQFGHDLKRRSPAQSTAVVQLTDGFSGYCPTMSGFLGGGYSGDPTYWTRLEPTVGYRLVDASAVLLHQVFKD